MKLCECGCGKPAPISKRSRKECGHVKGQPIRFIRGHNAESAVLPHGVGSENTNWKGDIVNRRGYVAVKQGHNLKTHRYKLEHIIIAEKVLGKLLPLGAVVHHHNKIRSDNRKANLVICENNSYHLHLHKRERILRKAGLI